MITRGHLAVAALTLLVLASSAACGASNSQTATDGTSATTSSSPAAGSTKSVQATPGNRSSNQSRAATCNDRQGDGKPLDIAAVKLTQVGDQLVVTFTTTTNPPSSGTTFWSLLVASSSGDKAGQLGVKFLDGQQIAHFVFDSGTAQQTNLEDQATVAGKTITARFPYAVVDSYGPGWTWRAATSVNGDDVDACPEEGADPLNPGTLTFPG